MPSTRHDDSEQVLLAKQHGLWLTYETMEQVHAIHYSIEKNGTFTDAVIDREVRPRTAELALISYKGTGRYCDEEQSKLWHHFIGVLQAGRRITTGKSQIRVSNLRLLGSESPAVLLERLNIRYRRHIRLSDQSTATRIPPGSWKALLKSLETLQPKIPTLIEELNHCIKGIGAPSIKRQGDEIEVFERDAIALALETWGGANLRKKVLREAASRTRRGPAPFLANLQGATLREDTMINHDHNVFPGFETVQRYCQASVELESEGQTLTIVNVNRLTVEQTLGVDLIYYHHTFDSFVLVQYKRLVPEGSSKRPIYRPNSDSSLGKEMERMKQWSEYLETLSESASSLNDVRLSSRPFYLKLCNAVVKSGLDPSLIKGMYLPLDLWDLLLDDDSARGPRGGVAISWDTCKRKLNNTTFTTLLKGGWIGSSKGASAHLSMILEKLLGANRMVIIAAAKPAIDAEDYRRDDYGRFADHDDPLAST